MRDPDGRAAGKMRIHWKGMAASELAELSRMILERT